MAITRTELTTLEDAAIFLYSLRDKQNRPYFTNMETTEISGHEAYTFYTEESGDAPLFDMYYDNYRTVIVQHYKNHDEETERTWTYQNQNSNLPYVAFSTRNGACLVCENNNRTAIMQNIFVGKTNLGHTFIGKNTYTNGLGLSSDRNAELAQGIYHMDLGTSTPVTFKYNYSVDGTTYARKIYVNAMATYPMRAYPNVVEYPINIYFNILSHQANGNGSTVVDGKTYFTNGGISILDD